VKERGGNEGGREQVERESGGVGGGSLVGGLGDGGGRQGVCEGGGGVRGGKRLRDEESQ